MMMRRANRVMSLTGESPKHRKTPHTIRQKLRIGWLAPSFPQFPPRVSPAKHIAFTPHLGCRPDSSPEDERACRPRHLSLHR